MRSTKGISVTYILHHPHDGPYMVLTSRVSTWSESNGDMDSQDIY